MWKKILREKSIGIEDGYLLLEENKTYFLKLSSQEAQYFAEVRRFLTKLDFPDLYTLNFGNCIGEFHLDDLKIRVILNNLNHVKFFSLLSDISDFGAGLPFSYTGGQGGFKKLGEFNNPILYHMFFLTEL